MSNIFSDNNILCLIPNSTRVGSVDRLAMPWYQTTPPILYIILYDIYDLVSVELHRICRNYPNAGISYVTLMKSISI